MDLHAMLGAFAEHGEWSLAHLRVSRQMRMALQTPGLLRRFPGGVSRDRDARLDGQLIDF